MERVLENVGEQNSFSWDLRLINKLILCGAIVFCIQSPVAASDIKEMMGYLMASSLPTKPLSSGALDVSVSPGYDQYTLFQNCSGSCPSTPNSTWKMSGEGVGTSLMYSLTDHWGIGVMAGYGHLSGTDFSGNEASSNGSLANADIVFDPFSGNNFRLPFLAGLGYRNLLENDAGFGNIYNAQGFAFDAGLAPQFNTGFLRWILFGYIISGTPTAQTSQATSSGSALLPSSADNTAAGGGISVVYRPLNLTLTYIPAWATEVGNGEKSNVYSFTYSHRFKIKARTKRS